MGFYHGHHFWGMHFFWWIFWILIVIWIMIKPWPFKSGKDQKNTAMDILRKRYANGEITTEEFKERKAELERDDIF